MRLTVCTYNLHVNAVKHKPDAVLDDIDYIMSQASIAVLSEAGQAGNIIDSACLDFNLNCYNGNTDAAESTPILYKKGLGVFNTTSPVLTKRSKVNAAGAGPSTTKEKNLNSIGFNYNGVRVIVRSIHTTPSIYLPKNGALNRKQIMRAAQVINMSEKRTNTINLLGGDFNCKPTSRNRNPLESLANMKSSQLNKGIKRTNGRRSIDDWYVSNLHNLVTIDKTWTHKGVSDHLMYFMTVDINANR